MLESVEKKAISATVMLRGWNTPGEKVDGLGNIPVHGGEMVACWLPGRIDIDGGHWPMTITRSAESRTTEGVKGSQFHSMPVGGDRCISPSPPGFVPRWNLLFHPPA